MEEDFKMAYREALLSEVERLKSVINENGLSGMDIQHGLLDIIYEAVYREFKGFVPKNSHDLARQVIEQLVSEKVIFRDGDLLRVL